MNNPTHPQTQSLFISKLPREIRNLIYREIWRSYGLRQHLQRHWGDEERTHEAHLCHWPCTTPFDVRDPMQDQLEALARKHVLMLGEDYDHRPSCRALQSPWINHWECGERAEKRYGIDPIRNVSTASSACWKDGKHNDPAPYLPMLLSCKLISPEGLSSIYKETTFIFTDPQTALTLNGFCDTAPLTPKAPVPLSRLPVALLKYATGIEISLYANFAIMVPCANARDRTSGDSHSIWDFHWLGLNKFDCLKSLRIWIAARGPSLRFDVEDEGEIYSTQLDKKALMQSFAALDGIRSVTISAPLSPSVGEEEGYVEGLNIRAKLWKRGCGDRFHPFLVPTGIAALSGADEIIYSFENRQVRVAKGLNAIGFSISPAV